MSAKGPPVGTALGLVAGSKRFFRFALKQEGAALDLTNLRVWFFVGYTKTGGVQVGERLCTKDSDVEGEVEVEGDAEDGIIKVTFEETDTLGDTPTIPVGEYFYDIWVQSSGDKYAALAATPFSVTPGVGPSDD